MALFTSVGKPPLVSLKFPAKVALLVDGTSRSTLLPRRPSIPPTPVYLYAQWMHGLVRWLAFWSDSARSKALSDLALCYKGALRSRFYRKVCVPVDVCGMCVYTYEPVCKSYVCSRRMCITITRFARERAASHQMRPLPLLLIMKPGAWHRLVSRMKEKEALISPPGVA